MLELKIIKQLSEIDDAVWDALVGARYPFLSWAFLNALEQSGDVSEQTGWTPQHICVWDENKLIAVMPNYLKEHSHGEYVFDQTWANAYYRHDFAYYPKWVSAIPFTPCQGPRLVVDDAYAEAEVFAFILKFIDESQTCSQISSWHCLFPEQDKLESFKHEKVLQREALQFQWFNKEYKDFDEFLATFKSKYRKNLKRERRRVSEQGIVIKKLSGKEIDAHTWAVFFEFYQATYFKRGMPPYLSFDFFKMIAELMPDKLLMVVAQLDERIIACALSFVGEDALYGRYWGCFEEYNNLHFELCYYQGIEYCIEKQLKCFNSGAQGEHKISRGFVPVKTYSLHYIRHPDFKLAIEDFLRQEKEGIQHYQDESMLMLPFSKANKTHAT